MNAKSLVILLGGTLLMAGVSGCKTHSDSEECSAEEQARWIQAFNSCPCGDKAHGATKCIPRATGFACFCGNECLVDNGGCDPRTACTPFYSGRVCGACPAGYTGTGETGCTSVCDTNNGGCDPRTTCQLSDSGVRVCGACPNGYDGTGETGCTLTCLTDNGGCDPLTTCKVTDEGRICGACPIGYVGTGESGCTPVCLAHNGGCDPLVSCEFSHGARVCGTCPEGYGGTGDTHCSSVCDTDNGGCDPLTTCRISNYLRVCSDCPAGFSGDPLTGCTPVVTQVAAGANHTCALFEGGVVRCWGRNEGQLGGGNADIGETAPPRATPIVATGVTALAAGNSHTCALYSGGAVRCWGDNNSGQLGTGNKWPYDVPPAAAAIASGATAIAAGRFHTCALLTGGAVECWGSNAYGQLGTGATQDPNDPPTLVAIASGATAIAAGSTHTCALLTGGAVTCWGANQSGQLGTGDTMNRIAPPPHSIISSDATAITAGPSYTCALVSGGAVKCWGNNRYGQLGTGDNTNLPSPPSTPVIASGATAVVAGGYFTCAILTGGAVECWGNNSSGQLGVGDQVNRNSPTGPSLAIGAKALSLGGNYTCAVLDGGGLKCWGTNVGDELGSFTTVPTDITWRR